MNSPDDLEAIIAKWPKSLTEPRFRLGEQHALQELYNNSKSRGSVSMRSNELATRLCMSEAQLETLMRPMTYRHVQYRNNMYSLRSDGLMIFESPYDTNSKLVICLHDLQALDKQIELPDAARAAGMGEFSITKYYLKQMEKQALVNIWEEQHQNKPRSTIKLTGLGWHLAEYLIKVKNIKPKIYMNGYKRYEKVF